MKRKALDAKFAPSARGFTATITTDVIDSDGEVVIPQGMNATEYETNPILLFNHDPTLPIGRCTELRRSSSAIVGDFEFAQKPDGYSGSYFPEFVASLVGQGIVKGISIGYKPEQGGFRRATVDDRKRWGDTLHTVYSKWKLFEISVAPLQANPLALVSAIRKGMVKEDDAMRWLNYEKPRKIIIDICVPPPADARRKTSKPIDYDAVVRSEIARARGKLWM